MLLPSNLFLSSIAPKKVYWFSANPPSGIPKHFHICVSKTDNGLILFACCTSQEDTMNRLIKIQKLSASTIVYVKKGDSGFEKDTFVNCNNIFSMTSEEFCNYYDSGGIELKFEIELGLYNQIVNGIKESKLVEIEHKKIISNIE